MNIISCLVAMLSASCFEGRLSYLTQFISMSPYRNFLQRCTHNKIVLRATSQNIIDIHMTSALRGGEGGLEIFTFCGQAVLIGCVNCRQRGGRESENPKLMRSSYVNGPFYELEGEGKRAMRRRQRTCSLQVICGVSVATQTEIWSELLHNLKGTKRHEGLLLFLWVQPRGGMQNHSHCGTGLGGHPLHPSLRDDCRG